MPVTSTFLPTCVCTSTRSPGTSAYVVLELLSPVCRSVVVVRLTGTTLSRTKDLDSVPAATQPVYVTVCASPPELFVFDFTVVSWALTAIADAASANVIDAINRLMCFLLKGLPCRLLLHRKGQFDT